MVISFMCFILFLYIKILVLDYSLELDDNSLELLGVVNAVVVHAEELVVDLGGHWVYMLYLFSILLL